MSTTIREYDLKPFVIYRQGKVIGLVNHRSGDAAVDKAEEETGYNDCTWNKWENATAQERKTAMKRGAIT